MLGVLAWAVGQGERASGTLHSLLVAHTPWQALRILWMVYSTLIWGVYVLLPCLRSAAPAHRRSQHRIPGPTRWMHAVLWGLVFVPLVVQYDRTMVLPWPLNGVVIVGLGWAFYEMVWKDL
jgi:hypothetical protein